jgi:hypothetical protein
MKKHDIIIKWLNKEFGGLTKVVKSDKTFYVDDDGKVMFYYYSKAPFYYYSKSGTEFIYINDGRIWSLTESIFGLEELETEITLKIWLGEVYNLYGSVMIRIDNDRFSQLEENYNLI